MSQLYFLVMSCLNKTNACKNLLKITAWGREECSRIKIYGKISVFSWISSVSLSLLSQLCKLNKDGNKLREERQLAGWLEEEKREQNARRWDPQESRWIWQEIHEPGRSYGMCTLSMTYFNESQLHKSTHKNLANCRKKTMEQ